MMRAMNRPDRTHAAFGRNVALIRSQRGLSQDKLAEKADLDRTYVSGIERGVRNPATERRSPYTVADLKSEVGRRNAERGTARLVAKLRRWIH